MKRVVVTGVGALTPIGNDAKTFWSNIKAGVNGIDTVASFDASELKTQIAGEIKDFDILQYVDKKDARKMDKFTQYAIAAADEAVKNSGLDMEKEDPWRVGCITGSGIGGILTFEEQCKVMSEKGPGRVSPFFIPMMIGNIAPCQIANLFFHIPPSAYIIGKLSPFIFRYRSRAKTSVMPVTKSRIAMMRPYVSGTSISYWLDTRSRSSWL